MDFGTQPYQLVALMVVMAVVSVGALLVRGEGRGRGNRPRGMYREEEDRGEVRHCRVGVLLEDGSSEGAPLEMDGTWHALSVWAEKQSLRPEVQYAWVSSPRADGRVNVWLWHRGYANRKEVRDA